MSTEKAVANILREYSGQLARGAILGPLDIKNYVDQLIETLDPPPVVYCNKCEKEIAPGEFRKEDLCWDCWETVEYLRNSPNGQWAKELGE